MYFKAFWGTLFKGWVGLLSGGGSVVLLAFSLWFFDKPGPRAITLVVSVCCFFVAAFVAWKRERKEVERLQTAAERPLIGDVFRFTCDRRGEKTDGKWDYDLLFQVGLTNESADPLILTDCRLQATWESAIQKTVPSKPLVNWEAYDGTEMVSIPDLHTTLGLTPLAPHIPKEGWFGFVLKNVRDSIPLLMSYRLLITDEKGRTYTLDCGHGYSSPQLSGIGRKPVG